MMDPHRRAVYLTHSQAVSKIGDRRIYYVVMQKEPNKFTVISVLCVPTAAKRDLTTLMTDLLQHDVADLKVFKANGDGIEELTDLRGRFTDESYRFCRDVDLSPRPLAQAA